MDENKVWDNPLLAHSHSGEVEIVYNMLTSLAPNSKILDVGCGYGALEILLFPKFNNVVGVDVSKEVLKRARANVPKYTYFHVDINKGLPFGDKKFDCVVCIEVLEHIMNPVFAIREMMRVGKRMIIACPNGFWTELRPTTRGYLSVPNYVHFTEKQLKNIIREFGGKIISFKYFTTTKHKFLRCLRNLFPRFFCSSFIVDMTIESEKK